MAHTLSVMLSAPIQALWRLVRYLFGRKTETIDVESGAGLVASNAASSEALAKDFVTTCRPDLTAVSAFVLASTTAAALGPNVPIGAKAIYVPCSPCLPIIVVSAPEGEDFPFSCVGADAGVKLQQPSRPSLRPIVNGAKRIYGQTPPRKRRADSARENIRDHPHAPCRPKASMSPTPQRPAPVAYVPVAAKDPIQNVKIAVATPASSEWEREKAAQLAQAREWSARVQARRRSLPTPPPSSSSFPGSVTSPCPVSVSRRVSAPARLPLQERLKHAVSGGASSLPPTTPAVQPLWGNANVTYTLGDEGDDEEGPTTGTQHTGLTYEAPAPTGPQHIPALSPSSSFTSSSAGSLDSILNAFEEQLKSSLWLDLPSLEDLEEGRGARSEKEVDQVVDDDDHWSDVVSLEDYV
ncbi:hypothetical protein B0H11DRAFT_2135871 [Mycena galericulata]|nr:hypothetical protein B0H11DRAFT_2135871 [Mycena galericulata]